MGWILLLAPVEVSPDDYLGFLGSLVVVYGLLLAVPLLLIAVALVGHRRYQRRAAEAEAAYRPDALLSPGTATLFGTVEHAEDAEHAVRVEVDQEGSESESSGSWSHAWKEVDRRVKVHPFYIRHISGRRVRVEPQRDVFLVDAMDGVIRVNLTQRTRVAELTPGEEVYAHGLLEEDLDPEARAGRGMYRDSPRGLVLRSPRRGRMLLSSEPLGARFLKRAGLHRSAARVFVIVLALAHLALLPYHLRLIAGRTVKATVARLEHYTTKDDEGDTVHHYKVHTTLPGGAPFTDDVPPAVFRSLAKGELVPVRRCPLVPSYLSNIGESAEVHFAALPIGIVLLGFLSVGYIGMATRKRWYEGQVTDTGSGKLHESLDSGKETIDDQ